MLPWIMERGEVPLADVARQFDLTVAEVERDLSLAAMCGLPPYVDELVDVFIDEGVVYAGVPRLFTRPLRLTAPEGFALLASGRAALQMPGAEAGGALARALDKLADLLGDDGATVVDGARPELADTLTAAADASEHVRMRYYTASRDEVTERTVTARLVAQVRGRWYLVADDHRSGEERVFRIDRIESCERLGVFDAPRTVHRELDGEWFDSDVPEVQLVVDSEGRWVAEAHPVRSVDDLGDGTTRITLAVASPSWLATLLLRLGPHVVEVEPSSWTVAARERATEVLRRYEATGS
jgi:proteasome accessory factor C